jgi:cytochrome c peroxidase
MKLLKLTGGLLLFMLLAACQSLSGVTTPEAATRNSVVFQITSAWDWQLPPGYPEPAVPEDNPMTEAKVSLGRHLFYDTRLSVNGKMACASCHEQKRAFSDGKVTPQGVHGDTLSRNSMALSNVGYAAVLTWGNPHLKQLETQMLIPIFGETPPELGLVGRESELLQKLAAVPLYQQLFAKAYPEQTDSLSLKNLTAAIASFERSLVSANSAYDRYLYKKEASALSAQAKRGEALFFSERLECFHCHGGFNFSDASRHKKSTFAEYSFHNTGLYNLNGKGDYPVGNRGVFELSQQSTDMGKFKAPSLRNIEVTAPYMHDGSIATLAEVIEHYAAGGRNLKKGELAGDGAKNPYKSGFIKGFKISEQEKADLLAFLKSLTDTEFLNNPAHANPWPSASGP